MRTFCLSKLLCLGIIPLAHAFHVAQHTRKLGRGSALNHSTRSSSADVDGGFHNDDPHPHPSRRDILIQSAGLALSSVMIGTPGAAWAASDAAPKTIVMTGASSGKSILN